MTTSRYTTRAVLRGQGGQYTRMSLSQQLGAIQNYFASMAELDNCELTKIQRLRIRTSNMQMLALESAASSKISGS